MGKIATQEKVRSEPPPLQANKLSADKMQFLNTQHRQPEKNLHGSTPGRLVIPDFAQHTSTAEVKEHTPSPKLEKRVTEEWVTQIATQEEVRSQPPPLQANKLSADKMQFLHTQDRQPEKNLHGSTPGRLVIPDFAQHTSTAEVKEHTPSPKLEKRVTEEWVTQIAIQEKVRSEPPPLQANKLSADKMQFLHTQDRQPEKNLHGSTPGRLVIPDFAQHTSTTEVKEHTPSPKLEKRVTEEWVTQIATQEEVRSEPPPLQANKLSADKMQFLHTQDRQPENNLHASTPGRLVIPDFAQHTSTAEVKEHTPSPKLEKRVTEEWVTQIATQEKVRSEPPPLQANKLSADKMQFLHTQERQPEKNLHGSTPGRLVIPDFAQHTSTTEVKEHTPSPKLEKRVTEEWVTQIATQEEVRSEPPPLQANKLSADKMQFLHTQDRQPENSLHGSTPGRLVIPDFAQHTSTAEVKEHTPSPKLEKRVTEEWVTQIATQKKVRSEPPPLQANKLSADKMQFLHTQDRQPAKNLHGSTPGRLVIPDFAQHTSTTEVKEHTPSPKLEKRVTEEWVTQIATQEEVRSEPPPLQANKLSADKMQFLHTQDRQPENNLNGSFPGRLVIPDFAQHTSTTEVKEHTPSPKLEKRVTEEWVTQIATQEEVRSEPPPLQANKLSADKMQFLHTQDRQPEKNLHGSTPGRLVIPDFAQHTSTTEVKEHTPSPKLEKRVTEEWVTQIATQEKVRSEPPPLQANKVSADKMQFFHTQHRQPEKNLHGSTPGRLVIPDFAQHTSTTEVKEHTPSPKLEKRVTEEWVTQIATQEEVRSQPPPLQANKLSADKMQFLHTQDRQPEKNLHGSTPGRLVIPDFAQHTSTTEVKEHTPSPKLEKRVTEEWVTQIATQEEVRSEPPPLQANKLSADKMQFLHTQHRQPEKNLHGSTPGRLVIPDFAQHTSTTEVKEHTPSPKLEKRVTEEWVTQIATQEEVRSQPPPLQANKLSADKMQFLHTQDRQPENNLHGSTPGRLVIPDFAQHTSTTEVKEHTPSPKLEKRVTEEWVTQIATQEEVRSEPPPLQANKLSADKMQFLHTQDRQPENNLHGSTPGRLVIPDFAQHTSTTEVKEHTPSPKLEKRVTEEWVTQIATQEEVRSEPPPLLANKLSADKMRFLHTQDRQPERNLHGSTPGRLVIPDFAQHTSTTEVKEHTPSPKLEKRVTEEWVTQIATQEEVRSEPPPLRANKLSADKMQFLHTQDRQPENNLHGSTPGRLVIPDFAKHTSTTEVKEHTPSPKLEKRVTEEWVTQIATQEEVRSEPPPLQANKLSADKMQFLHTQDRQPEKNLHGSTPGRRVIPDIAQHTSTTEVKEHTPSPKLEKRVTEEWVTQIATQEEVRSEPPPLQANKLSADKMQFLHTQDRQPEKNLHGSTPGRLVIPDFAQHTSTTEVKEHTPSPKLEKRVTEEWVTQIATQEEVRSQPPPLQANKLSADKMQFLHTQDRQPEKNLHGSTPGRLVIPDFAQHTSTTEVKEHTPAPKLEKRVTEEWVTQIATQEEVRSQPPPLQANKLSADKMQFLHTQDRQPENNLHGSTPGRLVIPDFAQHTSTAEVKEHTPSPKLEKRVTEEWVTQIATQEKVRSEPPPLQANKLSADKMQFLHTQDRQPENNLHGSTPGRLVIPDFAQHTSTAEVKEHTPSPKLEKRVTEEWVTQIATQEEVRSEPPPLQANKLSADKMQFLHTQHRQPEKNLHGSTPGRLVIPDFAQHTSTTEVKEHTPSPKLEKRVTEEWVTQIATQEEVRSQPPPLQANKLSADKLQFLHTQDRQPENNLHGSFPGKLVIPDFAQHTSTTEVKEHTPSPKLEKRVTEEWVTQIATQEEVRSQPPPLQANKLSADKMQFLHTQDRQPEKNLHGSTPGRLVIPDFAQHTSTTEVKEHTPSPKLEKRVTEEWVTQIATQEEVRSEPPPLQANKLSADKMQFLHTQDRQPEKNLHGSTPGRLVIPDFAQHTSTTEVKEHTPSPKLEKRVTEEWVTQIATQEEVRSQPPPLQANKLSADKMQFLHTQDRQPEKNLHGSTPGRLVIPDFAQHTSTTEVKEHTPSPKLEKRVTEEWVTQIATQEEVRSEPPPLQANKLSADKMQFLHTQDRQPEKNLHGSTPGRLVIPDFAQHTSTTEVKEHTPSPKLEKRVTEEWVTQIATQEEVRSQPPPLQANKLSADKMQFLHTQDRQPEKNLHGSTPGRLVIPDFAQHTSTTEVKEHTPSPKLEKRVTEEWVTQIATQEEVRSQPPPLQANKLSADKMQFLHTQDRQPEKNLHGSTPGRLVIPDFAQHTSTTEVKEHTPSPKLEKRVTEEWVTQIATQEEVRSEPPPLQANKLSADKMQFLHTQDRQPEKNLHGSTPGRLVIPDFAQHTSTTEVKEHTPSPKLEKRVTEEWVTQIATQEEVRSQPPPLQANKLSADKMQFLHTQDRQPEKNLHGSTPGRLVIPDFAQHTSTTEVKEHTPSPKLEKRVTEEWVTQIATQEEVRSQPPPLQANKLSADKMQFLHTQDRQPEKNLHGSTPGRLVIPDFAQHTSTTEVKEHTPSPKLEKRVTEEWVTQIATQEEVRSEPPPLQANKLSADKMQFLHTQDRQPEKNLHGSTPGRLVIPDFAQHTSTTEVKEHTPSPKLEKRVTEEWVTQIATQEEVRSEPPPLQANKLSADKMQFLHTQHRQPENNLHGSTPGRLVIPDFAQHTSTTEVKEHTPSPKLEKRVTEEWVTQIATQEEVRSQPPPLQANKLSADKMQFLHTQDRQPEKNLHGSTPGRLVIPDFAQHTSTTEVKEHTPSPKLEKRVTEEWVTQIATQEKVRSEPPPLQANKLSADKMQFFHTQHRQPEKNLHGSTPGRLVIPDFAQHTSTTEVKEHTPSPKLEKRVTEEWVTQIATQEEVRSEPPPLQANKLSADKMQFLHTQDRQPEKNLHGSTPGRLVIPDFAQHTSTTEVKEHTPSPKLEKRVTEEWVTQIATQEEVRSEPPPLQANKLSADKMQFLHTQHRQPEKNLHGSTPGRLVIPDFAQHTSTTEVKEYNPSSTTELIRQTISPRKRTDKLKAENFKVSEINGGETVRPANVSCGGKLVPISGSMKSGNVIEFGQNNKMERSVTREGASPGRIVIPDFNQHTATRQEKRAFDYCVKETTEVEEEGLDRPCSVKKLSGDKVRFLHMQDVEPVEVGKRVSAGKLVIPDGRNQIFSINVQNAAPSQKGEKRSPEQCLTRASEHAVFMSEQQPPSKILSGDRREPWQSENRQGIEISERLTPDKSVVRASNEHVFSIKVQGVAPDSQLTKRNGEQLTKQTIIHGELESEVPHVRNTVLTAEKFKSYSTKDTHPSNTQYDSTPGKVVIPDFNQNTSFVEVQEVVPLPTVKKQTSELRQTQIITHEQLQSEPPPSPREAVGKLDSLSRAQKTHSATFDVLPSGGNVAPGDTQKHFSIQIQDTFASSNVGKRKDDQWIRHSITELPAGQTQFIRSGEAHPVVTIDGASSSGSVVIPVQIAHVSSPPGADIHTDEKWITRQTSTRLPVGERQFVQTSEARQVVSLDGASSNGSVVIPVQIEQVSSSPNIEIHNGEKWTTRQTSIKLPAGEGSFVNPGETHEVITLDDSSFGGVVIPIQIEREHSPSNVKIQNG